MVVAARSSRATRTKLEWLHADTAQNTRQPSRSHIVDQVLARRRHHGRRRLCGVDGHRRRPRGQTVAESFFATRFGSLARFAR